MFELAKLHRKIKSDPTDPSDPENEFPGLEISEELSLSFQDGESLEDSSSISLLAFKQDELELEILSADSIFDIRLVESPEGSKQILIEAKSEKTQFGVFYALIEVKDSQTSKVFKLVLNLQLRDWEFESLLEDFEGYETNLLSSFGFFTEDRSGNMIHFQQPAGISVSRDDGSTFEHLGYNDGLERGRVKDVLFDNRNWWYLRHTTSISVSKDEGLSFSVIPMTEGALRSLEAIKVIGNRLFVIGRSNNTNAEVIIIDDGGESFKTLHVFNRLELSKGWGTDGENWYHVEEIGDMLKVIKTRLGEDEGDIIWEESGGLERLRIGSDAAVYVGQQNALWVSLDQGETFSKLDYPEDRLDIELSNDSSELMVFEGNGVNDSVLFLNQDRAGFDKVDLSDRLWLGDFVAPFGASAFTTSNSGFHRIDRQGSALLKENPVVDFGRLQAITQIENDEMAFFF